MTHTIARRILLETGRGLAVLATAGLLVLGMLGALPASAAEPATSPDGTGVTVLAADAADAQSADEATDAVGTCADLTPTTGAPNTAHEQGDGALTVEHCSSAGLPGEYITVHGTGFAQRTQVVGRPAPQMTFKLDDNSGHFDAPQEAGTVNASGWVTVTDPALLPDANGEFTVRLRLPDTLAAGEVHWVRLLAGAEDGGQQVSMHAMFRVGEPPQAGDPTLETADGAAAAEVAQGDELTVRGASFTRADGPVSFRLTGPGDQTLAAAAEPGADGGFVTTVLIPADLAPGDWQLVAEQTTDDGTAAARLPVTVDTPQPRITTGLDTVAVTESADVDLTITVGGLPRPTVIWEHSTDGGATWATVETDDAARGTVTHAITRAGQADAGLYRATATNAHGSVQTLGALTVGPAATTTTGGTVRPEGWNCESTDLHTDGGEGACIVPKVRSGGTLHLEGTGWKTADGTLGSCIAIKFDGGAVDAANPPTTDTTGVCRGGGTSANVFAYVKADDITGDWIADVPIPTRANSSTLAAEGVDWADGERHSVTLLTGSSRSGDRTRSEQLGFGIGVRVDPAAAGTTETVDRVIVQQAAASTTSVPVTTVDRIVSAAQTTDAGRPEITPAAPVDDESELTELNAGDLTVQQDGTVLTVTFPDLEPGAWVYLHAWPGPQAVDWIQLDADRTVRFDIAALEPGDHRFSFVGQTGQLVGWVAGQVPGESTRRTFDAGSAADAGADGPGSGTSWNGPLLIGAFGVLLAGLLVTTTIGVVDARTGSARAGRGEIA
jgi:hypothetical protein